MASSKLWPGPLLTVTRRAITFFIPLLVGLVVLVSIGPRYGQLATVRPGAAIGSGQLQPADAAALAELGLSPPFYALYITALEVAAAVALLGIGLFILARRPEDRLAFLFGVALTTFLVATSPLTNPLFELHPVWEPLIALLRAVGLATMVTGFFVFPDGRFVPSWTRWFVSLFLIYVGAAFIYPPLRINPSLVWETPRQALLLVWGLAWLLALVFAQLYRYRTTATAAQRRQMRWVVFGLAVAVTLSTIVSIPLLVAPFYAWPAPAVMGLRMLVVTVTLVGQIFLATSIALAILRARLFDIDVIIRRTLIYTTLTALLAFLYFGGVALLQRLLSPLLGQNDSPLVIVLSTLAIAALFQPLRRRVQDTIDRRFFRRKYDAAQALARFAAVARDEVDLDELALELAKTVDQTVQPDRIWLWLRPTANEGQGQR